MDACFLLWDIRKARQCCVLPALPWVSKEYRRIFRLRVESKERRALRGGATDVMDKKGGIAFCKRKRQDPDLLDT